MTPLQQEQFHQADQLLDQQHYHEAAQRFAAFATEHQRRIAARCLIDAKIRHAFQRSVGNFAAKALISSKAVKRFYGFLFGKKQEAAFLWRNQQAGCADKPDGRRGRRSARPRASPAVQGIVRETSIQNAIRGGNLCEIFKPFKPPDGSYAGCRYPPFIPTAASRARTLTSLR